MRLLRPELRRQDVEGEEVPAHRRAERVAALLPLHGEAGDARPLRSARRALSITAASAPTGSTRCRAGQRYRSAEEIGPRSTEVRAAHAARVGDAAAIGKKIAAARADLTGKVGERDLMLTLFRQGRIPAAALEPPARAD